MTGTNLVFNPIQNDKILDQTKLKAFADDILDVTKMIVSAFDRVKTLREKKKLLVHNVLKRLLS